MLSSVASWSMCHLPFPWWFRSSSRELSCLYSVLPYCGFFLLGFKFLAATVSQDGALQQKELWKFGFADGLAAQHFQLCFDLLGRLQGSSLGRAPTWTGTHRLGRSTFFSLSRLRSLLMPEATPVGLEPVRGHVLGSFKLQGSQLSGATIAGARAHMGRQLEPARGDPIGAGRPLDPSARVLLGHERGPPRFSAPAEPKDTLAEWSEALASSASPQGRGLEPHSCH